MQEKRRTEQNAALPVRAGITRKSKPRPVYISETGTVVLRVNKPYITQEKLTPVDNQRSTIGLNSLLERLEPEERKQFNPHRVARLVLQSSGRHIEVQVLGSRPGASAGGAKADESLNFAAARNKRLLW